jgi:hypothetical protein
MGKQSALLFVSFDSILTQQMGSFRYLTRYSTRRKLLCIRRHSATSPYFNNNSLITSNFYTTKQGTSIYQLSKQNSFNMQFLILTTALLPPSPQPQTSAAPQEAAAPGLMPAAQVSKRISAATSELPSPAFFTPCPPTGKFCPPLSTFPISPLLRCPHQGSSNKPHSHGVSYTADDCKGNSVTFGNPNARTVCHIPSGNSGRFGKWVSGFQLPV